MKLDRRRFLQLTGMSVLAGLLPRAQSSVPEEVAMASSADSSVHLVPQEILGVLEAEDGAAPIAGATWYSAAAPGDGLLYRFERGTLAAARYVTADLLVDGNTLVAFLLVIKEVDGGPAFGLVFAALNQCQARLRLSLEAVNQNRWRYEREGAWLKPMCGGDRVDLSKVEEMTITVLRKSSRPARFCLTAVTATPAEPPRLTEPILPKGPLLDELGQSTLHQWPGKSGSAEEASKRLREQRALAPDHCLPDGLSRWGGRTGLRFHATGFFHTHHDGRRWWLVDPDGYGFWSAGLDCVRVDTEAAYGGLEKALSWRPDPKGHYAAVYSGAETEGSAINYLAANLIRAFGAEEWYQSWAAIALGELRRLGFNTVGNWSDWPIARAAGFPYVRPLHMQLARTRPVFRDMPDVFHPDFAQDAADFAEQLRETADDPALIGYFLMNEPTWGFAKEAPAIGMLFNTPACDTRLALSEFLRKRYSSDTGLAAAWGMQTTLAEVAEGEWRRPLAETARADLELFSTVMVDRLFRGLSDACREVAPHHLNLGARYATTPPTWALEGMRCFDVFSMNCYRERVRPEFEQVSATVGRPILVGEWHFGALDVGLPATGIGHVPDQDARGDAYRVYLEDAAAKPWCVGVHWFTMYDQSALGRFDGENCNIGFLDVCNRPYEPIGRAARRSHERLYSVARGEEEPYDKAPQYLPIVFP